MHTWENTTYRVWYPFWVRHSGEVWDLCMQRQSSPLGEPLHEPYFCVCLKLTEGNEVQLFGYYWTKTQEQDPKSVFSNLCSFFFLICKKQTCINHYKIWLASFQAFCENSSSTSCGSLAWRQEESGSSCFRITIAWDTDVLGAKFPPTGQEWLRFLFFCVTLPPNFVLCFY